MKNPNVTHQEGYFYPPHAKPLTGNEGFVRATWIFLRNPIEGFGPMASKNFMLLLIPKE